MISLSRLLPSSRLSQSIRVFFACFALLGAHAVFATPITFSLVSQSTADALIAFSKQAGIDVLFSYDELRGSHSEQVVGNYEAEQALARLLKDTGYLAHRNDQGKFVIMAKKKTSGELQGQLLGEDGKPLAGVRVSLPGARRGVRTRANGEYLFTKIPEGTYQLIANQTGYRSLQINHVSVTAGNRSILKPEVLKKSDSPAQLEPYVVESDAARLRPVERGNVSLTPRIATGNLDLPRTEDDPLPYKILQRDQILRSGVVDLNEFLQRELIDSDASTRPPEQSGNQSTFAAGSSNLNLRGYGADETVILVNGRRMPETVDASTGVVGSPDVNFIPLSLVQQVEVLPVSASALYSGNPVGGVINIVLRPDVTGTELTTTYTNALGNYDAAQSSTSLQHGETLLDGKLRVRVNATYNRSTPPTESELGYRRAHLPAPPPIGDAVYRATPNIRSTSGDPLFGPGTSSVTSVAPGSDGTGGISPFLSREGVRNLALFASPGGMAASPDSLDYPYGRNQQRETYYGSVIYDVFPWLQLGADGIYARSVVNRGYDVFVADLELPSTSPFNPFGQNVNVSLNEIAPKLGENYSEARLETVSAVFGAVLKLPADWNVSADAQYSRNVSKYRGVAGTDTTRWQQLVDEGRYNPLRDTQVSPPPQAFYDEVITYYGSKGRYVTLGDYDTVDTSLRVTDQALQLPTGRSSVAFGGDYRISHLADYTQEIRYADGTLAQDPEKFKGRTLERQSVFAELQAPLLPSGWLPRWLTAVETDVALRYISSDLAHEANFSPVYGLKFDFPGGFTLRGSFTSASRFPTPQMSRPVTTGGGAGPGVNLVSIFDPKRNNENYNVVSGDQLNPNLFPESSVTQSAGLLFRRGQIHRVRVALDFADTRKTNELFYLGTQQMVDLESLYPGRVIRAPLVPGDPNSAGKITSVVSGTVNASWRHSQNWNLSVDYAWTECFGGTFEAYARAIYLQSYVRQLLPGTPEVDELRNPDGSANGILKYRANFGAGWNNKDYGFGIDGQYYHSRSLPVSDWIVQGSDHIKPYTQFDLYLQHDLRRWLPWNSSRYGLRAQLRINNIFGFDLPKYVKDPSGSGVQPYGDWRKQSYSFSLTATF